MATTDQTQYVSARIGVDPDDVVLELGGQQFTIYEGYDLHESVFEHPAVWSVRTGSGATISRFLQSYPPRTTYQLFVGGALQATGRIDSIKVSGGGSKASEIIVSGRDALAPVHDSHVNGQFNFTDTTYTNLVWDVLQGLGLVTGSSPDLAQLASTNDANRNIKANHSVTVQALRSPDQILTDESGNRTAVVGSVQITAKPGESWMTFLHRYLDPAGLILWAAADGTFVLSQPNTQQAPLYQITRRPVGDFLGGDSGSVGNAADYNFTNDCTHRHSAAIIYGRGGGRKLGVSKIRGSQVDLEMGQLGYQQVRCHHETHCQSQDMAENYALRKLAEERREGYQLWYTLAGHSLPLFGTTAGNGGMAVVTVDTIVQVDDAELGISGPFYIDTVIRSRSPFTSTKVRLVRPGDIFLDPTPTTSVPVPTKPAAPPANDVAATRLATVQTLSDLVGPAASSSGPTPEQAPTPYPLSPAFHINR